MKRRKMGWASGFELKQELVRHRVIWGERYGDAMLCSGLTHIFSRKYVKEKAAKDLI